ncbi:cytochrome P450 [Diplogelasinospora grovesii]|uniref:Cytochrome P450 n=1 Tax=Diplogelasinospora grovesii TaxID=303347 RepID=A0AAN6S361_9PEZI|nr:cytochrome P450 [Diplogelasinospora grovesii]
MIAMTKSQINISNLLHWALVPSNAVTVIAICIALLYFSYRAALPRPIPGIPYNEDAANSILGDIPALLAHRKRTGQSREWLIQQTVTHNSPIIQLFIKPFSKPFVLISDFRESQDISFRRTAEFDRSVRNAELFSGILPNNQISMKSSDPRLKKNKELMRDTMTPAFLHEVSAPEIYTKALQLVDLWTFKKKVADARPFEAAQDIFRTALDIINAAAFGIDDSESLTKTYTEALSDVSRHALDRTDDGAYEFPHVPRTALEEAVEALVDSLAKAMGSPAPYLTNLFNFTFVQRYRKAWWLKNQMVNAEMQKSIRRIETNDSKIRCALDFILQRERVAAKAAGRPPAYGTPEIRDEICGYIIAGHDTTASTLLWALKYLADNPESQTKLRSALQKGYTTAVADDRNPTASEIIKIHVAYLEALIEEVNRKAAVIPLISRQTTVEGAQVLGATLPKGTTVFLMSNGPDFRSPSIPIEESLRSESCRSAASTKSHRGRWDGSDVHEFRPERWLKTSGEEAVFNVNAGPMFAFGGGPRACFGRRLAYLELRIVIALLVWNFEFETLPEELNSYDASDGLTTIPKQCYVHLRRL